VVLTAYTSRNGGSKFATVDVEFLVNGEWTPKRVFFYAAYNSDVKVHTPHRLRLFSFLLWLKYAIT
jgi:hypothetical protein